MVSNFTTMDGAVTEVDESDSRGFPWKAMSVREYDSIEV